MCAINSIESTDMSSVRNVIYQTYFFAIAPRWLVQEQSKRLNLKLVELP